MNLAVSVVIASTRLPPVDSQRWRVARFGP